MYDSRTSEWVETENKMVIETLADDIVLDSQRNIQRTLRITRDMRDTCIVYKMMSLIFPNNHNYLFAIKRFRYCTCSMKYFLLNISKNFFYQVMFFLLSMSSQIE